MSPEEFNKDISDALHCLRKGGIILYPTDTIWGIGCDASDSKAVKRIFQLKKRADSKSMLTLVHNEKEIEKIITDIPDVALQLVEAAVNPITIIYDNANGVAPELISGDGSLGIRVTNERFSNELCRKLNRPLVSTSANISGEKAPSFFNEISDYIKHSVDYIVKYRREDTSPKKPSNIIKISKDGSFKIIR